MFMRNHHILLVFLMFLCSTGAYAQIHLGDGLSIGEGTSITIKNQEVIIATDEIKGKGIISIQNDDSQKITVLKNFKSNSALKIDSKDLKVEGRYAEQFAAYHLPPLSEEIIASKKENEIKNDLPVRYINSEGLTFGNKDDEKNKTVVSSLPKDVSGGIIISEVLRMQFTDNQTDYIIPIYSVLLNVERFSDNAELYEFECLTAILRPPIA